LGEAVKAQVIVQNKPSLLIIAIPSLTAGTYTLKLVTQFTNGHLLKLPRTCYFNKMLIVV